MNEILVRLQPLADLFVAAARRDPSVTQQQQVLVAAVVFLLVVLLVNLFLLVFMPKKRRVLRRRRVIRVQVPVAVGGDDRSHVSEPEPGDQEAAIPAEPPWHRRTAHLLLGGPVLTVMAILVAVATYAVSGTNAYCMFQCHQDYAPAVVEVRTNPLTATELPDPVIEALALRTEHHERCTDCHRSDVVTNISDRLRMLVASVEGVDETKASAVVSSVQCVRCHESLLGGVTVADGSNVYMSHAEPYEAGKACIRCHQRIGHVGYIAPAMTSCLECHDAAQVSADCQMCHIGNPSDKSTRELPAGAASKRPYRLVQLDTNRCYECHQTRTCDPCHGLRLPHPAEFVAERHARPAAWAGKQQCYRCHEPNMCYQCHLSFPAHYDGWEREHVFTSPQAGCSCHDRRRPERTEPFCTVCHW